MTGQDSCSFASPVYPGGNGILSVLPVVMHIYQGSYRVNHGVWSCVRMRISHLYLIISVTVGDECACRADDNEVMWIVKSFGFQYHQYFRLMSNICGRYFVEGHTVTHSEQLVRDIRGCIQKFLDWVDDEINSNNNKHSLRSNTNVMAAKVTRMTHKLAIQLHLVAESCIIWSSRSRRPVRKLLNTAS
jgi:hypothetical protein